MKTRNFFNEGGGNYWAISGMQKHFSDVLQMLFVPEIPILGIILKLLGAENKKNEFQKHFPSSVKWHKLLQLFFTNIKTISQELLHKLTSV